MKASNFRKFKQALPKHIADFSFEVDKDVGDDEWELPIHRHSAAEILVWILRRTGATLRKSQLVQVWRAIVRLCANMVDFRTFANNRNEEILGEIGYQRQKKSFAVVNLPHFSAWQESVGEMPVTTGRVVRVRHSAGVRHVTIS